MPGDPYGQDILDRLERGELDTEGALAAFDDVARRPASGARPASSPAPLVSRSRTGKIILQDVTTARPIQRDAVTPDSPFEPSPSRAEVRQTFPRGGRPVVELALHEHGIVVVEMRDEDACNMLTEDLLAGLREAFAEIEHLAKTSAAKVVVVTGTETWFCCGGTLEDLARMREGRASFLEIDGFRLLLDCSLPAIAAMRGHAVGGGLTFGLYADVVLLAENAYYSANFMEHGLTPGIGTTYILPKKMGEALASEMMLTAARYQGRELKARGVALEVLAKDEVIARAFAIARQIADKPVLQLELLKRRSTEETRRALRHVLAEEDRMHAQCFPRPRSRDPVEPRSTTTHRTYATLLVEQREAFWSITLNRPTARNSIDEQLLDELHAILDEVEADTTTKMLVLAGQPLVFCTGLDFHAVTKNGSEKITSRFMSLLQRLSSIPKIVTAYVDGDVIGGGMGLVAASDFVLATRRSTFALPEALWGLLPAMVLPFLIKRTGAFSAYAMTLRADTIDAEAARAMRLVDEVIRVEEGGDPFRVVEQRARRLERLEAHTIGEVKKHFADIFLVDEVREERAVEQIDRLLADPDTRKRMKDYAETGRLPWERAGEGG